MGHLLEIVTMTNTYPDFYRLIGPFLARRAIAKEIGAPYEPFWDDDGKLWFVALHQGKVAGFATLLPKGQAVLFVEAYVLPAYRNQGLHARLIDERLAHCPKGTVVQVIVKSKTSSCEPYLARGFTVKRERGKAFTEMTKTIGVGDE